MFTLRRFVPLFAIIAATTTSLIHAQQSTDGWINVNNNGQSVKIDPSKFGGDNIQVSSDNDGIKVNGQLIKPGMDGVIYNDNSQPSNGQNNNWNQNEWKDLFPSFNFDDMFKDQDNGQNGQNGWMNDLFSQYPKPQLRGVQSNTNINTNTNGVHTQSMDSNSDGMIHVNNNGQNVKIDPRKFPNGIQVSSDNDGVKVNGELVKPGMDGVYFG